MINASPAYSVNFCKNIAVNALLQYHTAATVEKQIKTDFQIQIPDNISLIDVELCTVLGNLLENTVEISAD